jgi:hypothetical protein
MKTILFKKKNITNQVHNFFFMSNSLLVKESSCFTLDEGPDGEKHYLGRGLYAKRNFEIDEVVAIFAGDKMTHEEYKALDIERIRQGHTDQYALQLSSSEVLDCFRYAVGVINPDMASMANSSIGAFTYVDSIIQPVEANCDAFIDESSKVELRMIKSIKVSIEHPVELTWAYSQSSPDSTPTISDDGTT